MAINTKINQNAAPTLALLKSRFPHVFVEDPAAMRPLKIGIHKDLFEAFAGEITRMSIRGALALYTSNPGYKPCIQPGVARIDLAGKPCGLVEEPYQEQSAPSHSRPKKPYEQRANDSNGPKRRGSVQHPARRVRARKQQNSAPGGSPPSTTQRPPRKGPHSNQVVKIRIATKIPPAPPGSTPLLADEARKETQRPIIKLKKRRRIATEGKEE